ncbi:MAG: recombinase zinc beta ribbon domain-containing protein [Candidatus Omnitrophica bacterium]|nr:recombinase zinc beta ribbon domain-containing protein [Candidatus Omnitrophota bacterium]
MNLWNKIQKSLDLNMPKKRNAKKKTIHTYVLQGLMKCGWCDSYMAPKYSTGRSRIHPYYQCTRNSRFGKSDCQMKYVPAEELEKLVLEQLKNLSHDKKLVRDIVTKANRNTDKLLKKLNSEKKDQENRLKPINEKIDNLIDAISSGVKKTSSINKKMLELEQNKEEIEKDVQNINFEIDKLKAQVLNAKVMHDSLKRFSEICDAATPQELKDLIPHFVEKITWAPSEIKIALFEQEVQRGPITGNVTTSKSGALQVSKWLPREDSNLGPSG